MAAPTMRARNLSRSTAIADRLEVADSLWARFMGLMGRPSLAPDESSVVTVVVDVAESAVGTEVVNVADPSQKLPVTCSRTSNGSFAATHIIGPAGTKMVGRFIASAPMMSAGVVLSQPPISTQPSAG